MVCLSKQGNNVLCLLTACDTGPLDTGGQILSDAAFTAIYLHPVLMNDTVALAPQSTGIAITALSDTLSSSCHSFMPFLANNLRRFNRNSAFTEDLFPTLKA